MYPASLKENHIPYFSLEDLGLVKSRIVMGLIHRQYSIGMHFHNFFEINLVVHGKGVHYVNGKSFAIDVGDIFVIPPGCRHGYWSLEQLDVYHLLLHPVFLARFNYELAHLPEYIMLFDIEAVLRKETNFQFFMKLERSKLDILLPHLMNILSESDRSEPESSILVDALALYIITLMCRFYRECNLLEKRKEQVPNTQFNTIFRCLEYIYRNYMNDIMLEDLQNVTGMTKSTLLRFFRRVTGSSPMEFINNYRVSIAKNLLLRTEMSITGIAVDTGFYDAAHFNHLFKKQNGITPGAYRNLYKPGLP